MPLQIEVYPNELFEGDNQITITILNDSQDICEDLVIHLYGDNLFIDTTSTLLFSFLKADDELKVAIELTVENVGNAILGMQCSWKQQGKILDYNASFQFNVKADNPEATNSSGNTSYTSTYLRDYYLNALPKWKRLLLQKEAILNRLKEQAAMWGAEWKAPIEIVNQINSLKTEISDLRGNIEEGEAYLRGTR